MVYSGKTEKRLIGSKAWSAITSVVQYHSSKCTVMMIFAKPSILLLKY